MKKVLESANMTNEGKWPIHQLSESDHLFRVQDEV
jgi:hypothetical protein